MRSKPAVSNDFGASFFVEEGRPFSFLGDGLKSALVTTAKGLDSGFFSFLSHHRSVGFEKVYLFLDDPAYDAAFLELLQASEFSSFVQIIQHDDRLLQVLQKTIFYQNHAETYSRRVVTRQQLNTGYATRLAAQEGIDWLCHLDSDELFGVDRTCGGVSEYLSRFDDRVSEVFVPNVEAVPQQIEYRDAFREVALFKKTRFILSEKQWLYMRYRAFRRFPFVGYAHGKSVFRPRHFIDIETPSTVHHYHPDLTNASVVIDDSMSALILHFPMCGFEMFRRRVSGFNLHRINQYEESESGIRPEGVIPEARDMVLAGKEALLPEYYREEIAFFNPREIESMMGLGLLVRGDQYVRF